MRSFRVLSHLGRGELRQNLWYNLVLVLFPVLLATLVYVSDKFITKKTALKITCAVCSFLMVGTAIVYVFFMNLRCRPTVESLQAGHDDYLASVKTNTRRKTNPTCSSFLWTIWRTAISRLTAISPQNKRNERNGDRLQKRNHQHSQHRLHRGRRNHDGQLLFRIPCMLSFEILHPHGQILLARIPRHVVFPSDIQSNPWSPTHFLNPYQFLNNVDGILGDEITFAEVLQAAGYNTGCIGKWNLGDYGQYLPTNQGFDYFYGSYYVNDMTPYNWVEDYVDEQGNFHSQEVRTHKETSTNPKARDCSPQNA